MDHDDLIPALGDWTQGNGPLHARLTDALRRSIGSGNVATGARLPAERALARFLGVSRNTVIAAYETLRAEGLISSRQGSGTYVLGLNAASFGGFVSDAYLESRGRLVPPRPAVQSAMLLGLGVGGGAIEFTGGSVPAAPIVSREVLLESAQEAALHLDTGGYVPFGLAPLRVAVAEHLTARGVPTTENEVLVTTGAQQAISLSVALLVSPGATVAVEDPTYTGALDVLRLAGAALEGLPVDADGVRVDAIAEVIARTHPAALYLCPTFQSPTGVCLSPGRRLELARLLDETSTPLIEDDALAETWLGEGPPPPPPVAALARRAPVLTLGSLSKVFWGGLRVGWIRATPDVIDRLARLKVAADHGSSIPSQAAAIRLFPTIGQTIAVRRAIANERLDLMRSLLSNALPDWKHERPRGGLLLWVRLPRGSGYEFAQVALRHGVAVVPGGLASPSGTMQEFLRMPFGLEPEAMAEGVRRLARAWSTYEESLATGAAVRVIV
jgi:DNA-binding transcriptional MocR family regulator